MRPGRLLVLLGILTAFVLGGTVVKESSAFSSKGGTVSLSLSYGYNVAAATTDPIRRCEH